MVLIDLLCISRATEIFWNTKPRENLRKFSPATAGPAYKNCTRKRPFIIGAIPGDNYSLLAILLIKVIYKVGLGPSQRGISRAAVPDRVKV